MTQCTASSSRNAQLNQLDLVSELISLVLEISYNTGTKARAGATDTVAAARSCLNVSKDFTVVAVGASLSIKEDEPFTSRRLCADALADFLCKEDVVLL